LSLGWRGEPLSSQSLPGQGLPIDKAKLSKGHIKASQDGFQKGNLQNNNNKKDAWEVGPLAKLA
jgi:hypothetical protein